MIIVSLKHGVNVTQCLGNTKWVIGLVSGYVYAENRATGCSAALAGLAIDALLNNFPRSHDVK